MSYIVVKSVGVRPKSDGSGFWEAGGVLSDSKSHPRRWTTSYLGDYESRQEAEDSLVMEYMRGCFQGGSNKFREIAEIAWLSFEREGGWGRLRAASFEERVWAIRRAEVLRDEWRRDARTYKIRRIMRTTSGQEVGEQWLVHCSAKHATYRYMEEDGRRVRKFSRMVAEITLRHRLFQPGWEIVEVDPAKDYPLQVCGWPLHIGEMA